MRKKITLLFLALFTFSFLNLEAQDKKLTYQDIVYMNPGIFPERINQLQWMGDADQFAYSEENAIIKGKATGEKRKEVFNLDDLNNQINKMGYDSLKRLPRISYISEDVLMFNNDNNVFLYAIEKKELKRINSYPEEAENIDIEENTFQVAYTIDDDLYVSLENEKVQITKDGGDGIVNGKTVHRNEFGISHGIFWSPEGNLLAFYRMDESMVSEYPLVDVSPRFAELLPDRYPMAGMTSHEVTVGVYNIQTKETVFLKTGDPVDQYLTNLTWGPEEQYIYIAVLNRDQNHLKLNKYDAGTGEFVQTLFEEKNDTYVEPMKGLFFLESDPEKFAWFSKRDGYNHLYLYNTEGELLKQLTKGDFDVVSFYGFAPEGDKIFFSAAAPTPIQRNIFSADFHTGDLERITSDHGSHSAKFSKNKKYFIDIFSSTNIARKYQVVDSRGKVKQVLLEDVDPLENYMLGEMEIFTVKNENGQDLYGRLIKPVNFDSTRKYPVINYVYGGPHSQLINDSWLGGGRLFLYFLAQEGYLVVTIDNRGTANRGFEFESAIFRNLGEVEMKDQMAGMRYIMKLPYADTSRIGVDGWSYGGFMTISLLMNYPEIFKAGVAGGPVCDWKYYEVMYGERYMDTPQSNPEGYEKSSLINKVEKLKSKLLILHGTNDNTVVWQNSLMFLKKCIEEGIQLDYFVYPGHEHNVRGKDRMHMYEKIVNYFNLHLK